jgi:aquaporin rerated protein, other eukaryote
MKNLKNHFVAAVGEFVGTLLFLWFAFAGTEVAASTNFPDGKLKPDTINYISMCFGFSLLATVWIFYRISGGLFNPAVCVSPRRTFGPY